MCGLVGVAGFIGHREEKTFSDMLVFSSVRGNHSTGIAVGLRSKKADPILVKSVGDPYYLLNDKPYHAALKETGKHFIIGHNRYATIGSVNEDNAHPFDFDYVVGAHNGTLRGPGLTRLPMYHKYDTDSQALYYSISRDGVEDVIPRMSGAWALTWYDKVLNTINFLRNSERELYFAYTEDRTTLLWASEAGFIRVAAHRNGLKLSDVYLLTEDLWCSWELPVSGATKLGEPRRVKLAGRQEAWHSRAYGYSRGYGWPGNDDYFFYEDPDKGKDKEGEEKGAEVKAEILPPERPASTSLVVYSESNAARLRRAREQAELDRFTRVVGKMDTSAASVPQKKDPVRLMIREARKAFGPFGPASKLHYKDARGALILEPAFTALVSYGCSRCSADIQYGDPVYFTTNNAALCKECFTDPDVMELVGMSTANEKVI